MLRPGGELLVSVPNLAHLQSRVHFLLQRTPDPHGVGAEASRRSARRRVPRSWRARAGFELIARRGIFPTVPVLTRLIRRHPQALLPLHRWLTRAAAGAGLVLPEPAHVPETLTALLQKIRELSKNLAIYGARRRRHPDRQLPAAPRLRPVPVAGRLRRPRRCSAASRRSPKLFFRWGAGRRVHALLVRLRGSTAPASGWRARCSSSCSALNGAAARRRRSPLRRCSRQRLLGAPGYTLALQLVLLNTFAIGFTFIPFHVLRMQQRSARVQRADLRALASPRCPAHRCSSSASGYGIWGVVVADVVVTAALIAGHAAAGSRR